MSLRRYIGIILTLALLAGQTLIPLARAACGMRRGAAPPACSFCAGARSAERAGSASLSADHSCCAVPKPPADRDPATVSASRGPESRLETALFVAPACASMGTPVTLESYRREAPPPLLDSPHRKTTVLLI